MASNSTLLEQIFHAAPGCNDWNVNRERALYQLASFIFVLAFMGGSGIIGCIFIFLMMFLGCLCTAIWGWMLACGLDIFVWNLLLMIACLLQVSHLLYRLRKESFGDDYDCLYQTVYQPLRVPIGTFKEIALCSGMQVQTLSTDQSYALEGKTPIDRLSLLLSGRVKVSLDGQFLHYIFPYQYLDSPEWESLRPSEEGTFQVTLTAETDCAYISWPRKRLYLLLAKEKYIARLFSVLLGFDISQKLYALNDKLFAKFGLRFDIRLPSLYRVLGPWSEAAAEIGPAAEPLPSILPRDHSPLHKVAPTLPHQPVGNRGPRPESGIMATTVLQKGHPRLLCHTRAPLAPTQTPEL